MKEDNNLEVKQTNSADYKPEIVEYKDVEHNNSSTLINAFMENNTIEESKDHDIEVEAEKKQEETEQQETEVESTKPKEKEEYPMAFKVLSGWVIFIGISVLIAYLMLFSSDKKRDLLFFILMLSSPITIPSIIINIFYDIYLFIRFRKNEDNSLIVCSLIIDIFTLIGIIALIMGTYKSVDFNMKGLG